MRTALGCRIAVGGQVIDLVLALFHARHIIVQRNGLIGAVALGGGKAAQSAEAFLVVLILAQAFLEHLTKLLPEFGIVLGTIAGEVFQHAQHLLRAAFADRLDVTAFLENFTRDIERQVVGIDHPAHEAQIHRHELLGVIHDEHALDVELDATTLVAVPQVKGRVPGHKQQLGVLAAAFHPAVRPGERILEIMRHVFVELAVLLVGDVRLGTRPQGTGLVDGFVFIRRNHALGFFVPFLTAHADRQRDVVGIFLQDLLDAPGRQQLVFTLAQMQGDGGAARGARDGLDRELARTIAFPTHALLGGQAGAARFNRHAVGNDEAGIKTDTELADQRGIFLLVTGHARKKLARTGFGDRAQMFGRLVTRHADAVVGNGDGACRLVKGEMNRQSAFISLVEGGFVERLETQLVGGVGGVGYQFAQEDFLVAVQGVNHQVQQLFDLGLKPAGFLGLAALFDCGVHRVPLVWS